MKFANFAITVLILFPRYDGICQSSELQNIKPYSITYSVMDMKRMTDWYSEKIGFEIVQTKDDPTYNTSHTILELNGFRVELIKDGTATKGNENRNTPPAHNAVWGQSQFAFYTTDLRAVEEELKEKGIHIEWKFLNEEMNMKFIFIRDPEGNLIQFVQRLN
jgi:catechol 2,3-dioxygenase-like lactoylglutathione lyase family enzyme